MRICIKNQDSSRRRDSSVGSKFVSRLAIHLCRVGLSPAGDTIYMKSHFFCNSYYFLLITSDNSLLLLDSEVINTKMWAVNCSG